MKLQAIALFGALLALPAFAQGDGETERKQKKFGEGPCLPRYLAHYDVNCDGMIDPEEAAVMKQARDQIQKQLRDSWDENGDGQICDQECDKARLRLRDMIQECRVIRFEEADTQEPEGLTKDEFETLPGIANKLPDKQDVVDAIFDRLDDNGDDVISLDEFLAAVRACERTGGGGPGSGPGS